jgi:Flp pilus assembly protein TadG
MTWLSGIGARSRRGERGQSAVEFAIVLPFVLMFTFFMVESVRVLSTWMVLEHASREGARVGAVRKPEADIRARTIQASQGILTAGDVTVTGAQGAPGTDVRVAVRYTYEPRIINGFANLLLGLTMPSITLRAQTHMRLEE